MSAQSATVGVEQRLAKALAHPLRMRALTLLNQRVASPSELAEELEEPLGNVAYHVRMLLDLDLIELVSTTPRRGAVEHHYRATKRPWLDKLAWEKIPPSLRSGVSGGVLAQIWKDTLASLEAERFDARPTRHLSRTPVVLDEQGWDEVADLLDDALEQLMVIQTQAARRLSDNGAEDGKIQARVALMHFEAGPG